MLEHLITLLSLLVLFRENSVTSTFHLLYGIKVGVLFCPDLHKRVDYNIHVSLHPYIKKAVISWA